MNKLFLLLILFVMMQTTKSQSAESDTVWSKSIGSEVLQVKFSPDGELVYVGAANFKPFVVSTATGETIREFEQSFVSVTAMDLSKDGKYLAVAGGGGRKASLIDVSTGNVMTEYIIPNEISEKFGFRVIYSASISYDVKYFAIVLRGDNTISENEGYVLIWEVLSGKFVKSIQKNYANRAIFSPTENIIAVCTNEEDADNNISVYNTETWKNAHQFCCHSNLIQDITFSPDSSLLASGGWDGVIKIWDVEQKKLVKEIKEEQIQIYSVCFINKDFILSDGGDFWNHYVVVRNLTIPSVTGQIRTSLQRDIDVYQQKSLAIIALGNGLLLYDFHDAITSVNEMSHNNENSTISPNPTNNGSEINFFLPISGKTLVSIADANAREIEVLHKGFLDEGEHKFLWLPKNVASGTYFCRISGTNFSKTLKIILEK